MQVMTPTHWALCHPTFGRNISHGWQQFDNYILAYLFITVLIICTHRKLMWIRELQSQYVVIIQYHAGRREGD